MSARVPAISIEQFNTFGDLLRFLRRRSGLTQRELSIAVGYSNTHICRLEQNQRMPDLPTISARFVSALGLDEEPKLVQRLVELAVLVRREDVPASGLAPYKGLLHFDEGDADLFFGREALTAKLTAKLMAAASAQTGTRCLAIVGASGSGKSSVARAGLVPALRWQKATAGWPVQTFTPTAHPLEALAEAVSGEEVSAAARQTWVDRMARDGLALRRGLERAREGRATLLVVDQFEELFTLCRFEAERGAFVDNLLRASAAPEGPAVVVITLRADFYGRCADFPKLREALAERQEYIGGMNREELRQAIESPAKAGSWELEPGLVEVMLKDVGAEGTRQPEPGALPLLSHALLETWERRRGRTLTLSGYAATGGVRGAIASTAEALFQDQLTAGQRDIARGLFLRMTELGADETQADTRRRAGLDELIHPAVDAREVREVLTMLADARLITTEATTAEIAHEALIREWPTLRGWLVENRESLRVHRHLTEAAREWERMRRDEGMVYRGARLAQALEWAAYSGHGGEMNVLEREFLAVSKAEAERDIAEREAQREREVAAARKLAETESRRAEEQSRAGARLRQRNRIVTGAGLVALVLAAVAGFFGVQANRNALQAEQAVQLSLSRQLTLQASSLLDTDHDLALLLSVEALRVANTVEARSALLTGLRTRVRIPYLLSPNLGSMDTLAISPDGAILAAAGEQGRIILWDLVTREVIGSPLIGHIDAVTDLAFSPDGRLLVSVGFDSRIILWDVSTRQPLGHPLTFASPTQASGSLAFSPSGSTLAAGFVVRIDSVLGPLKDVGSGHIRLWDVNTREQIADLSNPIIRDIGVIAFSPDGRTIASANVPIPVRGIADEESGVLTQPYISIWDLDNGQTTITVVPPNADDFALGDFPLVVLVYSHDGRRLAIANALGDFDLWDLNTGEFLPQLPGMVRLNSVAFSPDDRLLATGAEDGNVRLWDMATFQLIGQPLARHVLPVTAVAFTPDGRTLVSASEDGTVILWDLAVRQALGPPLTGHTTWVNRVAFSPDGQTVASGGNDGEIRVWDTASYQPVGEPLISAPSLGGLAFSPDGQLIASGGRGGALILMDAETHQPIGQRLAGHTDDITGLAFSPDGKRLASGSLDQSIRLWEVATGQPIGKPLMGHTGGVMAVAFSPDGKVLATGSRDQTIRLWDAATGAPLGDPLTGHTNFITSITFAPDGATLASGSVDGSIRLWEVATRQAVGQPLLGHVGAVLGVAISPDGTLLASGGLDKTVHLWDLATHQQLGLPFTEHESTVNSVAFSADGTTLASGSNDATVRLWDVSLASWQERACKAAGRNLTRAEWEMYVPGRPYHVTCPEWPAGG